MLKKLKNYFLNKHSLKVVAILAVRNEIDYLKICLSYLASNNIKIVIIDNDSEDGTEEFCMSFSKKHLITYEKYPYKGFYDWKGLLERKTILREEIEADWVIHHDADELMFSDKSGESLIEAIKRVDKLGYDSINLNEFVFVPENNSCDYRKENYHKEMLNYYYFAPAPNRLIRIFKNSLPYDNVSSGGHGLPIEKLKLYPNNFSLRHYICLNQEHAKIKYLNRKYSEEEIKNGWHRNRIIIKEENLDFDKVSQELSSLSNYKTKPNTIVKKFKHFWEW